MGARKRISFLYQGKLQDGSVFDESLEEAFTIETKRGQIPWVLEEALEAMAPKEEAVVHIDAQHAYGLRREDAVRKVLASEIPNAEQLPVGELILWRAPALPNAIPARVVSVFENVVELDFNHPLAGQDLDYWVKLVDSETISPIMSEA